jgi:hypothetical protein
MRKVIYSMGVSLDGFIAGPDGETDWSAPDEELHRGTSQSPASTYVPRWTESSPRAAPASRGGSRSSPRPPSAGPHR